MIKPKGVRNSAHNIIYKVNVKDFLHNVGGFFEKSSKMIKKLSKFNIFPSLPWAMGLSIFRCLFLIVDFFKLNYKLMHPVFAPKDKRIPVLR